MGYKEIELRLPVGIDGDGIKKAIKAKSKISDFKYHILRKSLDARKKQNIVWQMRIGIESDEITSGQKPAFDLIDIPRKKYDKSVIVVGSGPAGIFCALVLAEAGLKVTLLERGNQVRKRKHSIDYFEKTGEFDAKNNYAFGEGGAGTFSDGKLTSRTKGISKERNYIYKNFVEAGGPEEIIYMTHPHLGSDNLFTITTNLRHKLQELTGEILFDSLVEDINIRNNNVTGVVARNGVFESDFVVFATGHSAFETYRMLMQKGVPFQTKNFAIGMRAEHPQELINQAQWGAASLPGVKAAEYRLTASLPNKKPFYSFCMCPGGIIVPATAYSNANIVNGMSYYNRDERFANAAVVAGVHPSEVLGKEASPAEVLDWLEKLEQSFFESNKGFGAPSIKIADLLNGKPSGNLGETSYPLGTVAANIFNMFPKMVIDGMKTGLKQFNQKLKGYDQGNLVGLESKTSSPIQVIRNKETYTCGYDNLYITGEGSGWAGGIISSAADGIRVALAILRKAR